MGKINKFDLFKGAMQMSGQYMGNVYDSDLGKYYAAYLVLTKLEEKGSKFSLEDGVDIEFEAKAYQEEFDKMAEDE